MWSRWPGRAPSSLDSAPDAENPQFRLPASMRVCALGTSGARVALLLTILVPVPPVHVCAAGGQSGFLFSNVRSLQHDAAWSISSACTHARVLALSAAVLWEVSVSFFRDLIPTEKSLAWGHSVSWHRAPLSSPRAASGVVVPAPANTWVRIPFKRCVLKTRSVVVPYPLPPVPGRDCMGYGVGLRALLAV